MIQAGVCLATCAQQYHTHTQRHVFKNRKRQSRSSIPGARPDGATARGEGRSQPGLHAQPPQIIPLPGKIADDGSESRTCRCRHHSSLSRAFNELTRRGCRSRPPRVEGGQRHITSDGHSHRWACGPAHVPLQPRGHLFNAALAAEP